MTLRKALLPVALLAMIPLMGCSALQTAQSFSNVIGGILNIAKAEENVLPANDAAQITPWVNLGFTLEGRLNTCIAAVPGTSKKSAFASCFNSFASGLLSSSELAQLHIGADSQSKVQVWVTAVVVGVNGALAAFGGVAVTAPAVSSTPATSADLHNIQLALAAQGIDTSAWRQQ